MPRDGLSQYAPPPGTNGITNYTIESTKYNGFVADVTQDLNLPRPIVAGGTGASDAHTAMVNLGGEIAGQVVTNYDSFPFVAGSFWSAPGATSAPDSSHYFSGICYMNGPTLITLEARLITGSPTVLGQKYVRTKDGTGWSAWFLQGGSSADLDAAYVNVSGDTMSGNLTVGTGGTGAASPAIIVNGGNGSGGGGYFAWQKNSVFKWYEGFRSSVIGGNTSDDYVLYNVTIGNLALIVAASNSLATFYGNVVAGGVGATGTYYFGNSGTKSLSYNGTDFVLTGGNLLHNGGNIYQISSATTGWYHFGSSGTKYLNYDGANFNLVGGNLQVASNIIYGANSATPINMQTNGIIQVGYGINCRNGYTSPGGFSGNCFNMLWTSAMQLFVDNTVLGAITVTSDYRIKKDVIDLPGMWDTVKALRPIKYTQAQFSPPSHIKCIADQVQMAKEAAERTGSKEVQQINAGPLFAADNIERWGFIAHELQETLTPSAATGVKDAPDEIQSPQWTTIVAALTKALQEAMARIEALEAR